MEQYKTKILQKNTMIKTVRDRLVTISE